MDFTITDIDIYTLTKDNILNLARDYKVKIPSDPQSITVSELRQKLSIVKNIYKRAKRDQTFHDILELFLLDYDISDTNARNYPELLEFRDVLENIYDTVYESYVPPITPHPVSNIASNFPEYENTQPEKLLNQRKVLSTANESAFEPNENTTRYPPLILQQQVSDTVSNTLGYENTLNFSHINLNNTPATSSNGEVNSALNLNQHTLVSQNIHTMTSTNTENIPLVKPTIFHGQQHENGVEFLKKFELAARCNRWADRTKLDLFGTYISGIAYKWYSDFMDLNSHY